MNTYSDAEYGVLFAFGFITFVFIIMAVFYFLNSFILFKMGKRRGHEEAWIAFIPFVNSFYPAYLIKNQTSDVFKGNFLPIYVAMFVASIIPFIGLPFAIVYFFMTVYALAIFFRDYSDRYVAHIVIMFLTLGLSYFISMLMFINREPRFINKKVSFN